MAKRTRGTGRVTAHVLYMIGTGRGRKMEVGGGILTPTLAADLFKRGLINIKIVRDDETWEPTAIYATVTQAGVTFVNVWVVGMGGQVPVWKSPSEEIPRIVGIPG